MRRAAAVIAAVIVAGGASVARADVSGPDDTLAQANGPVPAGTTVSGGLVSATDVDDFAIVVPKAGTDLRFTVTNTTAVCDSPFGDDCPVWATLVDSAGNQVGGEGSSAGTGKVGYAGSGYNQDTIDWTFAQPGRYYLIVEGDGDDASGETPSYRFSYVVVPPTPATGAGGTGGPSSAALSLARLSLVTRTATVSGGSVALRIACRANAGRTRCTGLLALVSSTLGRGAAAALGAARSYSIPSGSSTVLHVRLSARARRVIAARRGLRARAMVATAGQVRVLPGSLLVRPPVPSRH